MSAGRGCRCQSSWGHRRGQKRVQAATWYCGNEDTTTTSIPPRSSLKTKKCKRKTSIFNETFSHESTFSSRIVHLEGWNFPSSLQQHKAYVYEGEMDDVSIGLWWVSAWWWPHPSFSPCCAEPDFSSLLFFGLLCGLRYAGILMIFLHTLLHIWLKADAVRLDSWEWPPPSIMSRVPYPSQLEKG